MRGWGDGTRREPRADRCGHGRALRRGRAGAAVAAGGDRRPGGPRPRPGGRRGRLAGRRPRARLTRGTGPGLDERGRLAGLGQRRARRLGVHRGPAGAGLGRPALLGGGLAGEPRRPPRSPPGLSRRPPAGSSLGGGPVGVRRRVRAHGRGHVGRPAGRRPGRGHDRALASGRGRSRTPRGRCVPADGRRVRGAEVPHRRGAAPAPDPVAAGRRADGRRAADRGLGGGGPRCVARRRLHPVPRRGRGPGAGSSRYGDGPGGPVRHRPAARRRGQLVGHAGGVGGDLRRRRGRAEPDRRHRLGAGAVGRCLRDGAGPAADAPRARAPGRPRRGPGPVRGRRRGRAVRCRRTRRKASARGHRDRAPGGTARSGAPGRARPPPRVERPARRPRR